MQPINPQPPRNDPNDPNDPTRNDPPSVHNNFGLDPNTVNYHRPQRKHDASTNQRNIPVSDIDRLIPENPYPRWTRPKHIPPITYVVQRTSSEHPAVPSIIGSYPARGSALNQVNKIANNVHKWGALAVDGVVEVITSPFAVDSFSKLINTHGILTTQRTYNPPSTQPPVTYTYTIVEVPNPDAPAPLLTPIQLEELKKFWESGVPPEPLAIRYSVTKYVILKFVKQEGYKRRA